MNSMIMIGIDLLAIAVLTFGVYFPRHHRRDLVAAFLGVNVGVLAVSMVLASTTVGAGLGLRLFGVLSIIRLRSSEISQHEAAYYFAALALRLLAGLATSPSGLVLGLMILIVAVLAIADHPRLFRGYRQQTIVVDVAHRDRPFSGRTWRCCSVAPWSTCPSYGSISSTTPPWWTSATGCRAAAHAGPMPAWPS